jgi:hypothetical protein
MAGKHDGANKDAALIKEEMKTKKIKKAAVAILLVAVWAAAAWHMVLGASIVAIKNDEGIAKEIGSAILGAAGPEWVAKHVVTAALKCGIEDNRQTGAKNRSANDMKGPYKKVKEMSMEESEGMSEYLLTWIAACDTMDDMMRFNRRHSLNREPYISMIVSAIAEEERSIESANALLQALQSISGNESGLKLCEWREYSRKKDSVIYDCAPLTEVEREETIKKMKDWHEQWIKKRVEGVADSYDMAQ